MKGAEEAEDSAARDPPFGEILRAGPLLLDMRRGEVRSSGAPVTLNGKAFAVLRLLMISENRLVTKDELFDVVWPGVIVSEAALTTAIKDIRQAIGDNARNPHFIRTVHGRGYRFLPPVTVEDETVTSPVPEIGEPSGPSRGLSARVRASLGAAALLLSLVAYLLLRPEQWASREADRSVAILPFVDMSPSQDQRWFADGLQEEVISGLSRIPDVRVASRVATERFRGRPLEPQAVGRELRVAHLLEGSVREAGSSVRVSVRLLRISDGQQIWAETYERRSGNVMLIQEEIGIAIARALKSVLDPQRVREMMAVGTRSLEAYEAYLQGLSLDQRQLDTGDLEYARQAIRAYEDARTADPNFAAAHWKAAQSWFGRVTRVDSLAQGTDPANAQLLSNYIERVSAALANARSAEDKLRFGAALAMANLRYREAFRLMRDYLQSRPRDLEGWDQMATYAAIAGEREWIGRAAEAIHRLSMEDGNPASRAITLSVMAYRIDEAMERADAQIRLKPDAALTMYQAHRAFVWGGQAPKARTQLQRLLLSSLPENQKMLARLRQACLDRNLPAARNLHSVLSRAPALSTRWNAHMTMGEREAAAELLSALDTPAGLGGLAQFMIDPTFEPREFPLLMRSLGQNGVEPPLARVTPHACPRTSA